MRRILRLVNAGTRPQCKNLFDRAIAASEINLADVDSGARIERFNLFLTKSTWRIEMINLLALDLAKKTHLGVKMEWRRRSRRTDKD